MLQMLRTAAKLDSNRNYRKLSWLHSRPELDRPTQPFNIPSGAVIAAYKLVGFPQIKLQFSWVPFERRLRETRGDSAKENRFRKRPGIAKARGSSSLANAGIHKFAP